MTRQAFMFATMAALFTCLLGNVSEAKAQTCVNNLFSGLVYSASCPAVIKPMKLVIHKKNNSWVSYTQGWFYKSADGTYAQADSSTPNQAFSDRFAGSQYFNIANRDRHRIRVFTNGAIQIYNYTWNFTVNLTAGCSNNLITASNSGEYYLISYGSTQGELC